MLTDIDPALAYEDPEFNEIWDDLKIQEQLQEVYNSTYTSESSHRTWKETYLSLIESRRERIWKFFIRDDEKDETLFSNAAIEVDDIRKQLEIVMTHDEMVSLAERFEVAFRQVQSHDDLDQVLNLHWESMERNAREILKHLHEYVINCAEKTLQIENQLRDGAIRYNELKFTIIKAAEEKLVRRVTQRFYDIRIGVIEELRTYLREKAKEHLARQIQAVNDAYAMRKDAKERLDSFKSNLSDLRVRYYSEPVEKNKDLAVIWNTIFENDQKIAILTCELKTWQKAKMDPVDSIKAECSTRSTSLYAASPVERLVHHKLSRAVSMAAVIQRLKVPQNKLVVAEDDEKSQNV